MATDKSKNDSSIPCKNCGHTGTEHKFLKDQPSHDCYLCKCANYAT